MQLKTAQEAFIRDCFQVFEGMRIPNAYNGQNYAFAIVIMVPP